ncbi:MAG: DUF1573 domain-containing protein [Candidatus Omnitrophica bacterium]|nr:DUF1573 domain-containing protein [Candidatus Omnitrophota bacterium]
MKRKVIPACRTGRGSRFWVLGLIMLFSIFPAGCYAQEIVKEQGDPVVEIAEEEDADGPYFWDFGEIKKGEIVEHNFVIKNDTEETLKITKVHTSCGCTASEVEKDTLLPQESTQIKVKFDSKGYMGEIKQYTYVHTDGPEEPVIKLTIKAKVVKEEQEEK